jgi:ATP-dependent helicase/nuclease subunit A
VAPSDAVRRAAVQSGLEDHLDEASADVERALRTLRSAGLARAPGSDLQVEYPVAGPGDGGLLLSGSIDLISVTADRIDVIDFKTDRPPDGPAERTYPAYASQVRLYRRLLESAGVVGARQARCGLLFTADGGIRWVP